MAATAAWVPADSAAQIRARPELDVVTCRPAKRTRTPATAFPLDRVLNWKHAVCPAAAVRGDTVNTSVPWTAVPFVTSVRRWVPLASITATGPAVGPIGLLDGIAKAMFVPSADQLGFSPGPRSIGVPLPFAVAVVILVPAEYPRPAAP